MSQHARRILPFVVLIVAVLLAYRISNTQPDVSKARSKPVPRLTVETISVQPVRFGVRIESFGTLQARTQSELFSLVSGQVAKVSDRFKSGAFFKQDEILLSIDPADYEIAVQVAKGEVVNAELALAEEQARYDQAQRDWKKQKQQDVATDFALRRPQLRAAEANLNTAKAQLKLALLNLERTSVRAPYDGRILETFVDIGSVVGSNVRLAKLYSTDAIEVRLPIANRDLNFVDLPKSEPDAQANHSKDDDSLPLVRIENRLIDPHEFWQGRVVRTEAAIDAGSQQLYVVARVDNPFLEPRPLETKHALPKRPLKIGQYIKASISGKVLEEVIVIPNSAVYQGSYVYLVEEQRLQRKDVSILWRNQRVSVLKSGLKAGDHLVTTLLGQVTSGTLVQEQVLENLSNENLVDLKSTQLTDVDKSNKEAQP